MNATPPLMTTSWDDGHPLDLRVAELLTKHGIGGTFYVPRQWRLPTMDASQIRQLADTGFELGGHTIDHLVLTDLPPQVAQREIAQSRQWLSDMTGQDVTMFCPPCGRFTADHARMIAEAGYDGYRTVELWSVDRPRPTADGILELPTSIQAQPQPHTAVMRNLAKRRATTNAWHYIRHGLSGQWNNHARAMLELALHEGGVFHLWGHSWELEDENQWDRLDQVLGLMATYTDRAAAVTNGQVCHAVSLDATVAR